MRSVLIGVVGCTAGNPADDTARDPVLAPDIVLNEHGWGCIGGTSDAYEEVFVHAGIYDDHPEDTVVVTFAHTAEGDGYEEQHALTFSGTRSISTSDVLSEWDVVLAIATAPNPAVPNTSTRLDCQEDGDGFGWTYMVTATRTGASSCAVTGHDPSYFAEEACSLY
jgi:hypothetical protein